MPKDNINYSNTIIYKICCKDENINDVYVGHTTNFSKRKYHHKMCCKTQKLKIYNFIRENGGWENWNMIEIANYNCKNSSEARIKEHYHYELLNATLNSVEPIQNISKLFCEECNVQFASKYDFENHKHVKIENIESDSLNEINESHDNTLSYFCKICNYDTDRKDNYKRHNLSNKHLKNLKLSQNNKNEEQKVKKDGNPNFQCICGNKYKFSQGLSKHKKKCSLHKTDKKISDNKLTPELILKVIEQNKEILDAINKLCNNKNSKY